MNPRIATLHEKKLVGIHVRMSFANNKTGELWKGFMQRRKEIKNNLTTDLFSIQIYDHSFDFEQFDAGKFFEKWAAVEVMDFNFIPANMQSFTLTGWLYAVFVHKGPASDGTKTFQYIFGTWLPNSEYSLDNRPHFELLGEKYKNENPDSEEEVWIPVIKKDQSTH